MAKYACDLAGRTAVYRCFDYFGGLLYVGISRSPNGRINNHRSRKWWWDCVGDVSVDWFSTRREALDVEAKAIRDEHPLYNVARPSVREVR